MALRNRECSDVKLNSNDYILHVSINKKKPKRIKDMYLFDIKYVSGLIA